MESTVPTLGELAARVEALEAAQDLHGATLDTIAVALTRLDIGTRHRFDAVDARFDAVDARFDAVDARFDAVDARFDGVDARFDAVDARFDAVDARFDGVAAGLTALAVVANIHDARLTALAATLADVAETTATTATTVSRHDETLDMLRDWLGRQP